MPSWRSYNPAPARRQRRFGLFPGRSPLLGESLIYFLFLGVLRCFSSPGSPRTVLMRCPPFERTGCPIRKSAGHRPFAPYRGLSQLITSFIASVSQGIRPAPFFTFSFAPSLMGQRGSYFQLFCGTTRAQGALCTGVFLTTVLLVQYVKDLRDHNRIYK